VGAGEDGQPDDVHVLLLGRVRDHLRGLAQAGVDDLEPLIPQAAGEDLGSAIVAVQARLGNEDADRRVGHAPPILAALGRLPRRRSVGAGPLIARCALHAR
jgi:hypothetical protein